MSDVIERFSTTFKAIAGGLAVIGAAWAGYIGFDTRYAKATETQQQIDGLKALYLQQRVSDLEREEFGFQREAQRRRLTDFEQERLNNVQRELHHLRRQLQPVRPVK